MFSYHISPSKLILRLNCFYLHIFGMMTFRSMKGLSKLIKKLMSGGLGRLLKILENARYFIYNLPNSTILLFELVMETFFFLLMMEAVFVISFLFFILVTAYIQSLYFVVSFSCNSNLFPADHGM